MSAGFTQLAALASAIEREAAPAPPREQAIPHKTEHLNVSNYTDLSARSHQAAVAHLVAEQRRELHALQAKMNKPKSAAQPVLQTQPSNAVTPDSVQQVHAEVQALHRAMDQMSRMHQQVPPQ